MVVLHFKKIKIGLYDKLDKVNNYECRCGNNSDLSGNLAGPNLK